jgi:hypothetical protein
MAMNDNRIVRAEFLPVVNVGYPELTSKRSLRTTNHQAAIRISCHSRWFGFVCGIHQVLKLTGFRPRVLAMQALVEKGFVAIT